MSKMMDYPRKEVSATISGTVLNGRGEGSSMGFSTANLNVPEESLPVENGVYAGYAILDGRKYKAAVSVGASPTFDDGTLCNVEAHVLGFNGDLYGQELSLDLVEYLRPMIKFDDVNELIEQISSDIEYINENF